MGFDRSWTGFGQVQKSTVLDRFWTGFDQNLDPVQKSWTGFDGRGGGTSSNLGGPLLNFQLQCSFFFQLQYTFSQVHFGLEI